MVDDRIWIESEEPVLQLALSYDRRAREISPLIPQSHFDWQSLRHFRLDRIDDMRSWAARQGKSVVQVPKGAARPDIAMAGRVAVHEPSLLKRDDARVVLLSRLGRVLHEGAILARLIPAAAVDSYVELQRIKRAGKRGPAPTSEMYRHMEIFNGAVVALSGAERRAVRPAPEDPRGDLSDAGAVARLREGRTRTRGRRRPRPHAGGLTRRVFAGLVPVIHNRRHGRGKRWRRMGRLPGLPTMGQLNMVCGPP